MADNANVKDAFGATIVAAADLLSDSSLSPKVTMLDGTGSPTGISPATSGNQTSANTKLDTLHADLGTANTDLAAILAKIIAAPSTDATLSAFESANHTDLVALATILGAVTASPTANTIADRLKTIATALPGSSSTGTQTTVAASATDVTILAANTARKGMSVYNDSTAVLYLLASNATSSATVKSIVLQPGDYWETPFRYTGVVKGIWATATGAADVTEYT